KHEGGEDRVRTRSTREEDERRTTGPEGGGGVLDARGSSEIGEGDGEEEVDLEEGAASTRMERRKKISPEGGGGAASGERR
ncbi:hypothetical protein U1Q18_048620, partial [Sarracenia purpurea var. burkii]